MGVRCRLCRLCERKPTETRFFCPGQKQRRPGSSCSKRECYAATAIRSLCLGTYHSYKSVAHNTTQHNAPWKSWKGLLRLPTQTSWQDADARKSSIIQRQDRGLGGITGLSLENAHDFRIREIECIDFVDILATRHLDFCFYPRPPFTTMPGLSAILRLFCRQ